MGMKVKSKSKGKLPSRSDSMKAVREKEDPKVKAKADKAQKLIDKQAEKDRKAADKEAKKSEGNIIKMGTLLPPLSEDERQKMAEEGDSKVREISKSVEKMSIEMGIVLRENKVYELWKLLKDKNGRAFKDTAARIDKDGTKHRARTGWENWVMDAMPQARSTGFALARQAELLLPYISKEELGEISARNRQLLSKVPALKFKSLDSPIRKAAKGSQRDLEAAIDKHAPEAHIEKNHKFVIEGSLAPIIADAFEAVKLLCEVHEDGHALEILAGDWLASNSQDERFPGMSNQEAFEAYKKQLEVEVDVQGGTEFGQVEEELAEGEESVA